ncbi:HotDog domain-containing protein [Phakopsora pachyrhizi]|uniref:HotDog domain-containing protein n=1 Tax=Phakopsora pachyrhizi TaxID=170000 RepID=A0AAV0AQS8_PHAPC|nr:HotDog domain-containing protein [Phakopsora pachyrhizi]
MAASTKFVKQLKIISAHPSGLLHARLPITQRNVNRLSTVHGGLLSTLVDTCGSLSISARGLWTTGVSTDIQVSFLRSAGTPGKDIDIEAKVDSIGRTLAFTSVTIRNSENGKIVARGSHTKYVTTAFNHEKNVAFDQTGDNIAQGTLSPDEPPKL